MLVLRRRAGETLLIGENIEIEILELNSQGAKIGIRAPRETVILRKELKITRQQNQVAAEGPEVKDFEHAIQKICSRPKIPLASPDKHSETERAF